KTEYQKQNNKEMFDISENHFSISNFENIKIFSYQHTSHYKSALKMFESNILFGKGPKMFRKLCKDDKYFYEHACSTHPHNIYIQLLAEVGIIGFLALFSLFIYILYLFIRIKFNHFKQKIIYDDYTILLLILIFTNFFPFIPTGNFFNNFISIYYFLPIGFLLAHLLQKKYNV
ncbi:O-antigen ligase family protein, partial [Pelagibacteraceae bacterium]|nr:O-antigen ligase family protein [Pelagibacteraceae bacterium]